MYAIISPDPLSIIVHYNSDTVPPFIFWPDKQITANPIVGLPVNNYVFVNCTLISNQPTSLHVPNGSNVSYDANTFTVTETVLFVEPPLADMQATAKARILDWRTVQQDSGFTFANVVFQSDPISRTNIEGAVSMALISNMSNTAYSVSWTAADNSQIEMDANTVIQFGVTAALAFQAWHTQSLTLKAQIDAANTAADIQAILDSVGA